MIRILDLFNGKNTITVNGKTYTSSGDITIRNGKIIADGKEIAETKADQVVIHGKTGNIDTDLSVSVVGTVEGNIESGGSVNCDDVGGSVTAGGSVNCDDIGGSVTCGGSLNRG